jgi:hypothetical protein
MIDHRYLSEMSKALHLYLDWSFLVCAVLTLVRAAAVAQQAAPATAKAPASACVGFASPTAGVDR